MASSGDSGRPQSPVFSVGHSRSQNVSAGSLQSDGNSHQRSSSADARGGSGSRPHSASSTPKPSPPSRMKDKDLEKAQAENDNLKRKLLAAEQKNKELEKQLAVANASHGQSSSTSPPQNQRSNYHGKDRKRKKVTGREMGTMLNAIEKKAVFRSEKHKKKQERSRSSHHMSKSLGVAEEDYPLPHDEDRDDTALLRKTTSGKTPHRSSSKNIPPGVYNRANDPTGLLAAIDSAEYLPDVVQRIFESNPKVMSQFEDPYEPLLLALEKKNPVAVMDLLSRIEDSTDPIKYMLDISQLVIDGGNVLHFCAMNPMFCKQNGVLDVFLDKWPELRSLDAPNDRDNTPLMLAVLELNYEAVDSLLIWFANPNAPSGRPGFEEYPIHRAISLALDDQKRFIARQLEFGTTREESNAMWIIELLAHNEETNLNIKDYEGRTPVHRAAMIDDEHLSYNIVRLLLACGANYLLVDKENNKPVKVAKTDRVKWFLESMQPEIKYSKHIVHDLDRLRLTLDNNFGSGNFSKVYKGSLHGTPCAVKVLELTAGTVLQEATETFYHEVGVMADIHHPHIVAFLGMAVYPHPRTGQILQCLITEYVDGFTLSAYLDKHFHRDFTWKLLFKIATETASAMAWLHSHDPPILHRDLHPSNILLTDTIPPTVKICDFGLAQVEGAILNRKTSIMARLMPQDKSTSTRSTSLDVYQFGFILFELLTHHSPHASTFTEEAIEAWKAETPFTIICPYQGEEKGVIPAGLSQSSTKSVSSANPGPPPTMSTPPPHAIAPSIAQAQTCHKFLMGYKKFIRHLSKFHLVERVNNHLYSLVSTSHLCELYIKLILDCVGETKPTFDDIILILRQLARGEFKEPSNDKISRIKTPYGVIGDELEHYVEQILDGRVAQTSHTSPLSSAISSPLNTSRYSADGEVESEYSEDSSSVLSSPSMTRSGFSTPTRSPGSYEGGATTPLRLSDPGIPTPVRHSNSSPSASTANEARAAMNSPPLQEYNDGGYQLDDGEQPNVNSKPRLDFDMQDTTYEANAFSPVDLSPSSASAFLSDLPRSSTEQQISNLPLNSTTFVEFTPSSNPVLLNVSPLGSMPDLRNATFVSREMSLDVDEPNSDDVLEDLMDAEEDDEGDYDDKADQ